MTMMPLPARLLAATAAIAVLLTACATASSSDADAAGNSAPSRPALNAATAPLLPTEVGALPAFDLATYHELLGQLQGTPVVVNIWASWCGPCRAEGPHLTEVAQRFGDRAQFLGVDILDTRPSARAFIEEFNWPYPSVFDADGAIRDGLGLIGQPVTLFYDARGELVSSWVGAIDRETLAERVEDLLG